MSELKAFEVTGKALFGRFYTKKVYDKDEADKVIAELEESHKMEVEQLLIVNREQANAANRLRDSMEQTIRHNKYKRCLVMARWCASRAVVWDIDGNEKKSEWYWKWKELWKELAKKFKPNKEAK